MEIFTYVRSKKERKGRKRKRKGGTREEYERESRERKEGETKRKREAAKGVSYIFTKYCSDFISVFSTSLVFYSLEQGTI
ncbi:hypothetical protein RIF29_28393 [Crotalaria pallida]|uniref:Uncharacterized protein n=1 Tax=Crotalaria pallida TaxID=3830 RepID=A0AAN9HVB3_CROPI